MKVIDLLNKIAKGEEVPKKIKYRGFYWNWCEACRVHETRDENNNEMNLYKYFATKGDVNDEVEEAIILEYKIREQYLKLPIEELNKNNFHKKQRQLANKINELTRKVNYLLEKESDK